MLPLFLSLFFSITIFILGPFLNLKLYSIFLFSGGFALSDYLRAKILTGFPWNLWAYSFSWNIEIIQIVNKIGFFAFNLIIITLFTLPAIIFLKKNFYKKLLSMILTFLVLFVIYIYGNHSINQNKNFLESVPEKYYIKVISPNFDLKYGLSSNDIEKKLNKIIKYSEPLKI